MLSCPSPSCEITNRATRDSSHLVGLRAGLPKRVGSQVCQPNLINLQGLKTIDGRLIGSGAVFQEGEGLDPGVFKEIQYSLILHGDLFFAVTIVRQTEPQASLQCRLIKSSGMLKRPPGSKGR